MTEDRLNAIVTYLVPILQREDKAFGPAQTDLTKFTIWVAARMNLLDVLGALAVALDYDDYVVVRDRAVANAGYTREVR